MNKDNMRQMEIVQQLFKGKRVNTRELAEFYNVTMRTIQKDIKKLKSRYSLKKEKGEYFLPEEYLNEQLKTMQDMHPLAMDMVMSLVNKTLPNYLSVIQDTINIKHNNIFLFDFEIEEIKNETLFINIKNAILENKSIKFEYKNREKNVYPLKIANFNSYWYLIGYDLESMFIKTFYIDDINNLQFHKESFLDKNLETKLKNLKITSSWYNDNPKKEKLILINEAKKYISRRTPSNITILKEDKDSLEIEFFYFNEIELLNFIKKWLGNIKIQNPELKNRVKTLLEEGLKIATE